MSQRCIMGSRRWSHRVTEKGTKTHSPGKAERCRFSLGMASGSGSFDDKIRIWPEAEEGEPGSGAFVPPNCSSLSSAGASMPHRDISGLCRTQSASFRH